MMELEDVLRFSKQLQGSISCSKQQNVWLRFFNIKEALKLILAKYHEMTVFRNLNQSSCKVKRMNFAKITLCKKILNLSLKFKMLDGLYSKYC